MTRVCELGVGVGLNFAKPSIRCPPRGTSMCVCSLSMSVCPRVYVCEGGQWHWACVVFVPQDTVQVAPLPGKLLSSTLTKSEAPFSALRVFIA